jgi:hypothetical protein
MERKVEMQQKNQREINKKMVAIEGKDIVFHTSFFESIVFIRYEMLQLALVSANGYWKLMVFQPKLIPRLSWKYCVIQNCVEK